MDRQTRAKTLIGIIKFIAFKLTEDEVSKIASVIQEALNRLEKECMEGLEDGNE